MVHSDAVSDPEKTPRYRWSTSEAGAFLGVSQRTAKFWARDGAIPAIRTPGGHYRFDPDELAAWQESLRVTS
jgi:excisionase family DNA binding protein